MHKKIWLPLQKPWFSENIQICIRTIYPLFHHVFQYIYIKPWDKYRLGTRIICQASTLYCIARIFYIRDLYDILDCSFHQLLVVRKRKWTVDLRGIQKVLYWRKEQTAAAIHLYYLTFFIKLTIPQEGYIEELFLYLDNKKFLSPPLYILLPFHS